MDISLKRIIAYMIDIIVITLIVTILTNISIINPYKKEYNELRMEYQNLIEETSKVDKESEDYKEKVIALNYELGHNNWINGTLTVSMFILYFGLYNYFNKGKTIGKKIMKLQLVNVDEKKKLSLLQCLIRTIILNNVLFRIVLIIGPFIFTTNIYFEVAQIISFIESTIETILFAMIVLRKDNRGLHDIIARTRVIEQGT